MSIKVIDNFDLRVKKPLDKRFSVNNLSEIDKPYEGLKTYQISDETYYKYINGVFVEDTPSAFVIAETLPEIVDRKQNTLYFRITDTMDGGGNSMDVSPNMGLKLV